MGTSVVVMTGVLLALSGWGPGVLLNTPQYPGWPPREWSAPNISSPKVKPCPIPVVLHQQELVGVWWGSAGNHVQGFVWCAHPFSWGGEKVLWRLGSGVRLPGSKTNL